MKKNLNKKKIAFFHELDKGGARRSSNEFSKQLLKKFDIDLFIIDDKRNLLEEEYYSKIHFFRFKPKIWEGNNWKVRLYKDTVELFQLYFIHKKIASIINSGQYDAAFVLPSKYTQAPFILRFLKIPVVYYCQEPLRMVYEPLFRVGKKVGLRRYYYEKINRFIRKKIDIYNLKKANVILSNSNYTGGYIKRVYDITSKTCYMGVDTSFFKPDPKAIKKYDILYIGAMDKSENYDFFIKTLKYMRIDMNKVRFLLKEKEWISSNIEMRKLYQSAKIIVCLGYKEPFGLMPIEAMACALPVVAINSGGYKETVIDGVNGYLAPKDMIALSQKIKMSLDPNKYPTLSHNARQQAVKYWSWKNSGVNLTKIISSLI